MIWTRKYTLQVMADALRFVARYGGAVGPAAIRSGQPAYNPTFEEHLEEWGIPERADDSDVPTMPRAYISPETVSLYLAAIQWQAQYIAGHGRTNEARCFSAYLMSKAFGGDFAEWLKEMGINRTHAYELRDRALTRIVVGLTTDRIGYNGRKIKDDDAES